MTDSHAENVAHSKPIIREKNSSACLLDLFQEAWNEILRENPVASEGHVEVVTRDGERRELTALEFWQQIIKDVETQKQDPDYLFTPEVEEIISENFTTAIEPRIDDGETPIRLGDKYYIRRSTQPYLKHLNCGVDQWFVVQDFPPKPDIIKILRRRVKDQADDDDKLLLEKLILALENSPCKDLKQTESMNPTANQPVLESSPDSVPGETSHTAENQEKQTGGVGGGEPHSQKKDITDESLAIPGPSGCQTTRSQSQNRQSEQGYRPRGVSNYAAARQPPGLQRVPVAPPPAHMAIARYSFVPSIQPLPAHRVMPYAPNTFIPTTLFWRYEAARGTAAPRIQPGLRTQMYPSFYPRLSTYNQPLIQRPPYPTTNPWVPQAVRQDHRVAFFPGENTQPAHVKAPDMSRFPYRYPTVNQTLAHQATIVYSAAYNQTQKRRRTQVSSELLSNNTSHGYLDLNSESAQFESGQNSYLDREHLDLTDIGDQTLNQNTYYFGAQSNLNSANEWIRSNLFSVNVPMGPTRCPSDLPPWSVNSGSEDRLLVVTLSPNVPPVQTVWSAQAPISSVFPFSLFPSTNVSYTELPSTPSATEHISNNQNQELNEKTEYERKESNRKISDPDSKSILQETCNKNTDILAEKKIATVNTTVETQQQIITRKSTKLKKVVTKATTPLPSLSDENKIATVNTTVDTQQQISTQKSTKLEKVDTKAITPQPSSSKGKSNKKGKNKQPARKAESESSVANFSDQQKTGATRKITVEFLSSALASVSKSSKKKTGDFKKSEPKPSTSKSIRVEFYSNGQSSNNKPQNQAKLTTASKLENDAKKKPQKEQQKISVTKEKSNEKSVTEKTQSVNIEKSTDKISVAEQKNNKKPVLDKLKPVKIEKSAEKISPSEEIGNKKPVVEKTKSGNPCTTGILNKEQVLDKTKPEVSKPVVDEREYLVTPTIFEILESRKNIDPKELDKPPTNYMEDVIQRKERRWKLMDKVPGSPRLDIILDMIKRDNEMLAEEERLAKEKEQQSLPSTSKEPDKTVLLTDALLDSAEDPFEVLRILADESRQKIEEDKKSQPQEDLAPNTRVCDNIKVKLDDEELGLLDNLLLSPTFDPDIWVSDNTVLELKEQLFDEWWADKSESLKKDDIVENQPVPEPNTSKTGDVATKKPRKKKKSKKSSSEQSKYSGRDEATQTDTDTADEKTVEQRDSSCQIKPSAPSYADMLKKKNQ